MNLQQTAAFSPNGEFFAFAAKDGILKIWKTSSNTKHVLNLISSNFTCSSLTWGSTRFRSGAAAESEAIGSDIKCLKENSLVIGTETGTVILYDVKAKKCFYHFVTAQQDAVTDLCWESDCDCLFSCSKDRSIAVWDTTTGKIKYKWEADEPLFSLCVMDSDNMLSAGTSILWWNIHDQTVLKKFSGHSSRIVTLLPVISTDKSSNSYFLSVAAGEAKINAWHLNVKNSIKSVASFELPDYLESVDVTKHFSKEKPMYLSAVMKKGSLLLFKHVLNGKPKENLLPQMTLNVVSKYTGESNKASTIRLIGSKFSHNSEFCTIAYGDIANPVFEKVKLSELPKNLTLARDVPALQNSSMADTVAEVKIYNKLGEFISANGRLPSHDPLCSSPKRKKQRDPLNDAMLPEVEEVTLDDSCRAHSTDHRTIPRSSPHSKKRLKKINSQLSESEVPTQVGQHTAPLDPRVLIEKILQCIQMEDMALLDKVLECSNQEFIRSTVLLLPQHCIRLFVIELQKRLTRTEHRYSSTARKWLKEVLDVHLQFLKTSTDLVNTLELIRDFIDRKKVNETLSKLSILRGLLNIQRIQHASRHTNSDTDESMDP